LHGVGLWIPFPPDLKDRVTAQLTTGKFENEEDVLREALGAMEKRQRGQKALQQRVREADADIAVGQRPATRSEIVWNFRR
jgi:Arc/MetJ-type ribon-helix-helix transcriptional regulator